jgi:hypothetical protein
MISCTSRLSGQGAHAVHRIHSATALAGHPAAFMTVTSGLLPGGRVLSGIPVRLLSFYKST